MGKSIPLFCLDVMKILETKQIKFIFSTMENLHSYSGSLSSCVILPQDDNLYTYYVIPDYCYIIIAGFDFYPETWKPIGMTNINKISGHTPPSQIRFCKFVPESLELDRQFSKCKLKYG